VRYNDTHDNSPSISGVDSALGESQSSASGSSAQSAGASHSDAGDSGFKAYEVLKDILENNSNTIIPSIGIVLIALFLLVVGYRRKEKSDL
jgi:LPXTG-motif cell wall-anchored protein